MASTRVSSRLVMNATVTLFGYLLIRVMMMLLLVAVTMRTILMMSMLTGMVIFRMCVSGWVSTVSSVVSIGMVKTRGRSVSTICFWGC